MKKIKLMVVTPYFYPKLGGVEIYAYNLAKGLKEKHKWEVVVISSNHESKEYKEEIINGIRIYRLPRQFKVSNTPISFKWKKQIKEIIEKEKPDVINAHSPVPFMSDVAARIAHKKRIPFYLTYHAGSMKKRRFFLDLIISLYEGIYLKKTLELSTKILPVSEYVRVQFPKNFKSKCIVTPNFIDKKRILKKNPKKKSNQLIFLGGLNKSYLWKGLEDIFEAISICKKKFNKNIKLLVVGDGDYKSNYELLARNLGISKNVMFKGEKHGKEKDTLIQESIALIFYTKTKSDAFPTVFLEAWANKTPIIAANIGPVPFLIRDGEEGLLVEPRNPEKLKEGISMLLNRKGLQNKLVIKGHSKVKNFILDLQINRVNKIFRGY